MSFFLVSLPTDNGNISTVNDMTHVCISMPKRCTRKCLEQFVL